jgi:hypothetical protein
VSPSGDDNSLVGWTKVSWVSYRNGNVWSATMHGGEVGGGGGELSHLVVEGGGS